MIAAGLPRWYWGVSATGLIWNLLGVAAFVLQMTMDLSSLPDVQREFHESTPGWATAGFALAVFGGVLGCTALLLRKRWAFIMLAVCVVGILVQFGHSLFIGNGIEVFGPQGLIMPILTLSIAIALVWFARYAGEKGWLD